MQFHYKNSQVDSEEIKKIGEGILDYVSLLNQTFEKGGYSRPEGSINLPFDKNIFEKVSLTASKLKNPRLKYVVNIGVGGSNLGAKAVYDAIFGHFDLLEPERFPKMIFADTLDGEYLDRLSQFLDQTPKSFEEAALCLVSKSGDTLESVFNFEIIYKLLSERFSAPFSRVMIVTESGTKLWQAAGKREILTIEMPQNVSGRFSVFSPAGLSPLALAGIDCDALLFGAREVSAKCLSREVLDNPALVSAVVQYLELSGGREISNSFFFHPELESLGKWYRQLMAESLGKKENRDGKIIHAGITPMVSIGTADLHSVEQLNLGGPKDKTTTLITTARSGKIKTPVNLKLEGLVKGIEDRSSGEISTAIYQGVKTIYQKEGVSFLEVILDNVSEFSLGEFLQFKMLEIMYFGRLLNVNTFDQPEVELYKAEAKKSLADKN